MGREWIGDESNVGEEWARGGGLKVGVVVDSKIPLISGLLETALW